MRERAKDNKWMIVWKGDSRTIEGKPLAVFDFEFAKELLECYMKGYNDTSS